MKAVVYTEYGTPDVLRVETVAEPKPQGNQVLVKVRAASVNTGDWYALTGKPFMVRIMTGGLRRPKNAILGADIAGEIVAVGPEAKTFQPGDAVFGDLSGCGLGGFAEYVAVPETLLAKKPARLTFEQAAAVPLAGVTALQGLRDKGQLKAGQKALIYGASGGVGTYAVQIAKALGAEVTGVCSTKKVEMVRELGADHVIDYSQEDFRLEDSHYDLIVAANGSLPLSAYLRALKRGGICVVLGGPLRQIFGAMLRGPLFSATSGRKVRVLSAQPNAHDLAFLGEMLDAGTVVPVIDQCVPLSETAEAMRYLGQGHARGKVVVGVA